MDKYLINILKEVNTIIIPGIGALTIVNQSTGEVMFMSFMKFDDEKLAEFIAKKEQWELNEAKNLVSKYVRDINTKLDQGDSYDIYQFGSFTKNVEGEIEFTRWNGSSNANSNTDIVNENTAEIIVPIAESIILETKNVIEEVNTVIENEIKPISTNTELNPEEIVDEINEKTNTLEEIATRDKNTIESSTLSNDDIEQIIPDVVTNLEPQILSVEEQLKDNLNVPPINLKKELSKKPILEKTKKDKVKKNRGVGFYILMGILVFLIGGGIFFGLNYNEMKQYVPFLADKSISEKTQITEKTEEENTSKENVGESPQVEVHTESETSSESKNQEQIEENTITPQPMTNGDSGIDKSLPIQIIVGSFSEESNATRKVESLKSQGLKAEVIGQYGGLYFVSAGSYSSMEEMKTNVSNNSSLGKYWVFKK